MSFDISSLNPAQRKAVVCIDGPSLIIAGAGSGKTRVLTSKIAHLIESGINPHEILALTFTNKAAKEMKERVIHFAGNRSEQIWMGTFHSMFARILRIEAELLGFTRNFTIYDTNDSVGVIKNIMLEQNISIDKFNPKSIHSYISKVKNKVILPPEFNKLANTQFENIVSDVYTEYFERMRRNNSMDFDDLLVYPVILLNRYVEILRKYQNRFKFILVDEYQDTNKAQYEIVKALSAVHKNITVVGDDAQSIYKWRGAEIQNIFDFRTDFPEHNIFRLEQNYRSTKKILDFAGIVINKNVKQIEKKLWTDNTIGDHITMIESITDKEEALKISRYISKEIQHRKLKFNDVAILYRTNAQSRTFEEYFRLNAIPYIIVGGIRFYERKEIKDILAHLRIIVNPADEESISRVLLLKEGFGKTTMDKLRDIAAEGKKNLYQVFESTDNLGSLTGKARNKILEVLNFINKYKYLRDDIELHELVRGVIDEMGILKALRLENTNEAEERINNIDEFVSAVADYTESHDSPSLDDFLSQVSLVSDIDEIDDKKNAVTLMTIHASKGLEFPVVFIAGVEEGIFPVTGSLNSLEELEEERRLFYVAVTRAMVKLYISFADMRYRFGNKMYQIKSRFLKEIEDEYNNKELVEYENFKSGKNKVSFHSKRPNASPSIKFKSNREEFDENDGEFSDIVKGKGVYHETFGSGVVIGINGKGKDKKADILFEDCGLKKIILKYAKLRVNFDN
ncbi:MAG: UvrD-helicase domain-containing protein [Candidatus Kapaibacterium sp.]